MYATVELARWVVMTMRPDDDAAPGLPEGTEEVSRVFDGTLASVPAARQFALDHLGWIEAPRQDELAVLVTELVTNAVVHVGGDVRVSLCFDRATVRVEVEDGGEGSPRVLAASPVAEGGRGLRIVDALAEEWGVESDGTGKVVWCVLSATAAGPGTGRTGS